MIPVNDDQIGGAMVRRRIDRGGDRAPLLAGQVLSREEVLAMPVANRRAMVATERLWLMPRAEGSGRFIVPLGRGQFDVVVGVKLNDGSLTKDEAEELATTPAI